MKRKRWRNRKFFQLPKEKENMKHVQLTDINPIYELYEDGSIFSRARGTFKRSYPFHNSDYYVLILKSQGNDKSTTSTFSKDNLVRKYITGKIIPQIEGVEHKPMIGYQGIYQIYSNGQVWSFVKNRWMTACYQSKHRYQLYCLQDANGKVKTEYVHRLLAENFILNAPLNGQQVHHKDHNQNNNSLDNLIILAPLEHIQFHKTHRAHSPEFLAKMEANKLERERIANERKQLRKDHPYHHSEQTKRRISEGRKRAYRKARGEE